MYEYPTFCILHHVFTVLDLHSAFWYLHSASCLYCSTFYTMSLQFWIMHHVFTVLDSALCILMFAFCIMYLQFWILYHFLTVLHSDVCILHHVFTVLHSAYACPQIMHHVSCLCNLIAKFVCLRNYVILRHTLYILLIIVIYYLSAIYMSF